MVDGWGITLSWISLDLTANLTDNKSKLVQVMAWCCQTTSHYLIQCWPRPMSPQWDENCVCGWLLKKSIQAGVKKEHWLKKTEKKITISSTDMAYSQCVQSLPIWLQICSLKVLFDIKKVVQQLIKRTPTKMHSGKVRNRKIIKKIFKSKNYLNLNSHFHSH